MYKFNCRIQKIVMKKVIKLLIVPVSLMLANCTNSQSSSTGSQSGNDSAKVDSTTNTGQGQDTMKADTPITYGQRSNPK
jgi:starvation-inducible outer membrane lipoprotein